MEQLMFLGFYHVSNRGYYTRDSFRHNTGQETYRMLNDLPEDERKVYLMTERAWRLSDAKQFEWDYNEELLDGEHWCVVFYMTRDEYRQVLLEIEEKKRA